MAYSPASVTQCPDAWLSQGGERVEADRDLMSEDARSIREGLWRMARYAHDAEALDSRIEDEDLDGQAEAVEVREALERLQALSLEVSEELDAYQQRHARQEI
jgi:valyl-tRNA synthetase